VTEGREGVKFGRKKFDIFFEWPLVKKSTFEQVDKNRTLDDMHANRTSLSPRRSRQ